VPAAGRGRPARTSGSAPPRPQGFRGIAYLCPPPEPCPLEALPADEDVLVLEDAAAVAEETEDAGVDRAPEYPLEVCDTPD